MTATSRQRKAKRHGDKEHELLISRTNGCGSNAVNLLYVFVIFRFADRGRASITGGFAVHDAELGHRLAAERHRAIRRFARGADGR